MLELKESARNIFVIACAFTGGILLGGSSKKYALEPIVNNESQHNAMPLIDSEPRDESSTHKSLIDFPLYDNNELISVNISPVIGDDGLLYDDGMLNLEDIIESLDILETTRKEELSDSLIVEEDITRATDEEKEEPETFLNEVENVPSLNYERKLSGQDFHTPDPACTEGLEKKCTTSFRDLINRSDESEVLVIPCGECIAVDYDDHLEITLPNGLSIEGKLQFPSTASITLRTKFVWVAGILEIETPDIGNQIKFSLYGDELHTYTVINPDSTLCSSSSEKGGCNMGSKVIAVVGGRLDIKGATDDCPAWEKLADIGSPTPRSFENHLPCHDDNCWEDNTIKLRDQCRESKGHTDALGKYTVYCPIESKCTIPFGESQGIKLTSIAESNPEFTMPQDENGQELSLNIDGPCGKAGHTNHFNKCTMVCPLKHTSVIKHGFNERLTFTSVKPENEIKLPPSSTAGEVSMRLKSSCWNSQGHTNAYKRCSVMCRLFPTIEYRGGENSGQLKFTSKFSEDPVPFPVPTSAQGNGEKGKFILGGKCVYEQGHTNAWGGCVVRCPMEKTYGDFGSYHKTARLNNLKNGKFVNMARILTYAHAGVHMFLLLQDVSKDQCSMEGANSLNDAFEVGDEVVPSFQISSDQSANGNTFSVDQVLHYSWNKDIFLFLPSEKDMDRCNEIADDFTAKFPPGYEVEIEHKNKVTGGDIFQVDGVHHWAWGGKSMYFFPEKSDVDTCDQTVADFNSKFVKNFGIDINKRRNLSPLGEEVVASNGVHHWSWAGSGLFFFSDETAEKINEKFPTGYTLKVDFLNATDVYDIQVSADAAECWKPGTELLLTSHTRSSNDQQLRKIESSNTETGMLRLSAPIHKPITVADSEDFAIEVAQLNRRIIFEAENDSNDENIGGHLIVHHTKSPQNIQGVEVRNFGQQGRLGRYPIHFHKCGDSQDSLVRRNVVRNSNQRCYVVHLSNKITIEENVAFDATGHCYFIEDGSETENIFRRNLGSGIKRMAMENVDKLGEKSKRQETDFHAAVFWISNPFNEFYGNVAAGGEGHGYWFETHGLRKTMSLGAFVDNVVHSTALFAFTTYSPGWRPTQVGVIENLKAYRNRSWGAFLHVTQNLHFKGGLFADNGDKGVMISRGDNLVFDGTTFIGQTTFADRDCHRRGEKVAIHLDPYRLSETILWNYNGKHTGTTVLNAKFLNWSQEDTGCPSEVATPLKFFSHQTFIKKYQAPHVFEDLFFDNPNYSVDAIMPGSGIDDVQIEVSSDKNDVFKTGQQSGFLIAKKLESMVPTACMEYNEGLKFCPDACIRTITVLTGNSAFFDDIYMIVKDESGRQIVIEKNVRGHPEPEPEANRFFAAYPVALPEGIFEISFEDSSGSPSWPKYVLVAPEAAPVSCLGYVTEADIKFVKPEPSRPECNDLVFNGDFDLGKNGWYAFHYGIELQETGGIGGTPALASTMAINTGNSIAQSIDGSCLEAGNEYDVSLSYKIVDYNGSDHLPYIRLEGQQYSMSDPANKRLVTTSTKVFPTTSESESSDWNTISGVWTIDENIANADKHLFYVGGGGYKIIIDNVTIRNRSSLGSVAVVKNNLRSNSPTLAPTQTSSMSPTTTPSSVPTTTASESPTKSPSETPTTTPSLVPTISPSKSPTVLPSSTPTSVPSEVPTEAYSIKELRERMQDLLEENARLRSIHPKTLCEDNNESTEESKTLISDISVRNRLR